MNIDVRIYIDIVLIVQYNEVKFSINALSNDFEFDSHTNTKHLKRSNLYCKACVYLCICRLCFNYLL